MQCSFTANNNYNEERGLRKVLRKVLKMIRVHLPLHSGKKWHFHRVPQLPTQTQSLRVAHRFSVVLIPSSCSTSFPSDLIFLTCSSTMTGQLKWHTLQVVAPQSWLSRYLLWFSVLRVLFYLFWLSLGYQRIFWQWHWITGRQNSSLIKSSILLQRFDPIKRWKSLYQVVR